MPSEGLKSENPPDDEEDDTNVTEKPDETQTPGGINLENIKKIFLIKK